MKRVREWMAARLDAASIVFVVAIVAGTILRVVGLTWGLPQKLHPDEWVIVNAAVDMAKRHSFEPMDFHRPDHIEIKLSYLAYVAYAKLFAHQSVGAVFESDSGAFYAISRAITAVFGVVMIVLAYVIGKRFARPVGAIAAVIFAIYPSFVAHSHYATPDIPLTVAVMVVILACMHYLSRPGYPSLLVASVGVSFAIAIKYPGVIAASMIAVVVIVGAIREPRPARILTHGAIAILSVVGFLFVISPVLFTNVRAVLAAIVREQTANHPSASGLGFFGNALFYVNSFTTTAGIIVSVCVILGIVAAIRLRLVQAIPLALGAILWLGLSALEFHWQRWGVPMFAAALLVASIGAYYSWVFATRYRARVPWLRWVLVAAAALSVINLLAGSIATVARLLAPDTRGSSLPVLAAEGVTVDNTIYEGYSSFRPSYSQRIFDEFTLVDGRYEPVDPTREFVLLSSCTNYTFRTNPAYVTEQALYDQIESESELVASFTFYRGEYPTPIEPVSIVRSITEIVNFAGGAQTGCDILVYRLPR